MLNKLALSRPPIDAPALCASRGRLAVRNFRLDDFLTVNRKLAEYQEILARKADEPVASLEQDEIRAVWWLRDQLDILGMDAAEDVDHVIGLLSQKETPCRVIAHDLEKAINSIDYQVRTQWTYHYGGATENISNYDRRWGKVLRAFPSTHFDIESALDVFALQHYTASVFHFMRVAEYGLRALANELSVVLPKGKPLTHANWQDIITHCERQHKQITHTVTAGPLKDEAVSFYSGALSQLHYLRSKYRNEVMHARKTFEIDEAIDASREVKKLMELLATKLAEKPRKKGFKDGKIDWGF